MRHAPAVTHPVGRTAALAAVLAGLCLAGGAAALAWLAWAAPGASHGWRAAVLLAAWLASGGGLWRFWRQQTPRELCFDGNAWQLKANGTTSIGASRVRVALDAQRFALLRLEKPADGRICGIWLWAEAGRHAASWHRLRCALYSPANQRLPSDVTDGFPPA
ncbi:MAG: hypothetical protein Q4D74_01500 [Comamonadaceae bacterium]|nr:hypothetical protein [Comamonadaceae bacterium]